MDWAAYTDSFTNVMHERPTIQEWVDETVREILVKRPKKVVEMGCGKGMILYRVAEKPFCKSCDRTRLGHTGHGAQQPGRVALDQHRAAAREARVEGAVALVGLGQLLRGALRELVVHVRETVLRGVESGHTVDNVALELNSLKFAQDRTFADVVRAVVVAPRVDVACIASGLLRVDPAQRLKVSEAAERLRCVLVDVHIQLPADGRTGRSCTCTR